MMRYSMLAILPFFGREIRLDKHHKLADLLLNLEKVMRQVNVWDMPIPSEEALTSKEPFCIDTMNFDQWLRYVMLEKFKPMLASGQSLPSSSCIAPMAQEFYRTQDELAKQAIVSALEAIDACLNQD
ncbi:hypothetical protein MED121_23269 [Marinomonas sp. MED121]|nr:hypothetical protein MED121_23269 [Marinomonas sp. MED121]